MSTQAHTLLTETDQSLIDYLSVQANQRIANNVGDYIAAVRAELHAQNSAAPDMLAALKALDAQWSEDRAEGPETKARDGFPEMHETTKAVWRQIRAAIAKAEGRS